MRIFALIIMRCDSYWALRLAKVEFGGEYMRVGHRKSIITQTVVRVSIVFMIVAGLLFAAIGEIFISSMNRTIMESQTELIDNMTDTIEVTFENLTVPLVSLANYSPARRLMQERDELYTDKWLTNVRALDDYLYNINTFYDFIIDIAIMKPDSTFCYSLTDRFRANYDYIQADWFREALEQESLIKYAQPHGTDHLTNPEIPSFTAIFPVMRNDVLQGYIMAEVGLSKMSRLFTSRRKGQEVGSMLIGYDGTLIFDYNESREMIEPELMEKLVTIREDGIYAFWIKDKHYLTRKLKDVNWYVVSENDFQTITQPVFYSIKIMIGVIAAGAILLVLVTGFTVQAMKKPFDRLIERISSYDGSESVTIEESDKIPWEIYAVRMKFETMAEHISRLIQDVYIATLKKQEMELQILTNQINPHFLYNTFQTIQTKAVLSGNREIEDMILALSGMLRYSMERTRDKVSLHDEVEYIKAYLMFYSTRFPQLFTYDITCSEELLTYRTIKFILQPVVENCFKHGFKNKKSGGIIQITIKAVQQGIQLAITDNGHGINPDALAQIRRCLEGRDTDEHIGLVNTNMRIRLAYGPDYGLEIDSAEGESTRVILRIKCEK